MQSCCICLKVFGKGKNVLKWNPFKAILEVEKVTVQNEFVKMLGKRDFLVVIVFHSVEFASSTIMASSMRT